jgi:hypothetical protein
MAPEILFRASGGYTAKADLWSVGCIAFELLHGRAPYGTRPAGTGGGGPGGAEARLREDIRRDRRYARDPPVAGLSAGGADLVNRLLQPNPVERAGYAELFRHPWLARGGAAAAAGGEQLQRSEMLRSRLMLVVSEAMEAPPPPPPPLPLMAGQSPRWAGGGGPAWQPELDRSVAAAGRGWPGPAVPAYVGGSSGLGPGGGAMWHGGLQGRRDGGGGCETPLGRELPPFSEARLLGAP